MLHFYGVTERELRSWTLGDFLRYRDFAVQMIRQQRTLMMGGG